jgi:dTDP-4-dehydrorhamnose reductase
MRILVTGASGLLGLNLALVASQQHEVFGVVHQHNLNTKVLQVIQADLLVEGAVERLLDHLQPEWVINCAALADLEACETDQDKAEQLNTILPEKLARYVAKGGARLVHVSTDAVFDGIRGQYSENDKPNPLSVYARTKLAGENAVQQVAPGALIARVNMFGWSLSGKRSLGEWFFYNLMAGRCVNGFTDVFFCPLMVNDLAEILLRMLELDLAGLYHVVSSDCISKYAFGVAIARQFGFDDTLISPIRVAESGLHAVRSLNLTLTTDKLSQALGMPLPGLKSGMERFYQLYEQGYSQKLQQLSS